MKRLMLLVLMAGAGCRGTAPVATSEGLAELAPAESVMLSRPAVGLWFDGDDLLVLEASGTRILRLDSTLAVSETIPLTTRLVGPQGIGADRYYIYVWDATTLYRMARDKLTLSAWMSNVRVSGIAVYAPAEVLVADASRNVVWYKGFFGEGRQFVRPGEVRRPGAMAALGDTTWGVLSEGDRLVLLNRLGIVKGSRPVPSGSDLASADRRGRVWVARRGDVRVTGIEVRAPARGGQKLFRLAGARSLVKLTTGTRLAVLDTGDRILVYELP